MNDKILRWLFTGQVGASSRAMAAAVAGMPNDGSHPHDPDDLNRCLLLLVAVPEIRNHMDRVADISPTWAKLAENWEALERSFLDEAGLNWCHQRKAPRTYAAMKRLGC
jgi:hypothetical protein